MIEYRIVNVTAFSCGRGYSRKHSSCGRGSFLNGLKKMRFQKILDSCRLVLPQAVGIAEFRRKIYVL